MSKKIWALILCLGAVVGAHFAFRQDPDQRIQIGIIQTATHPALDAAKNGFIQQLQQKSGQKVRFSVQNAEGLLTHAQSIAESYHAKEKIQAIYAIGTPAVQAIARAEKQKPIFIAAVSAPVALGIVYPGTNVCGTTDRIDTEAQADLILRLIPNVAQVAILYNPAEKNSQVTVEQMCLSLQTRKLSPVLIGVHAESEIAASVISASKRAQVILVPADNLLVGAMPLLAKEATKRGLAVVASDVPSVLKGALFAYGADYEQLGRQAADIAYAVLMQGKTPEACGIVDPLDATIVVNKSVLQTLQLSLPIDLVPKITFVE